MYIYIVAAQLNGPIPPSITVFSNESTLRMTWPKYWSFSFNRRGLIAGVTGPKFGFFLNHRKLVIINY